MSAPPYGNASRSIHKAVRDLTAAYLDSEGIASTSKREPTSLSDSLSDDVVVVPDLALAGVDLDVSSRLRPYRMSELLESVQHVANIREVPAYGYLQWRGDRHISESYVVMDLASFSRLVRGDHLKPPP